MKANQKRAFAAAAVSHLGTVHDVTLPGSSPEVVAQVLGADRARLAVCARCRGYLRFLVEGGEPHAATR